MITRSLPEPDAVMVGYGYLIEHYQLPVPAPRRLSAVSKKHVKYSTEEWSVYTPRHDPGKSWYKQLVFALRYEGLDLAVFKALFEVVSKKEIEAIVKKEPQGSYSRRVWFLFEYLMEERLDIPDMSSRGYVDVLNPEIQYPGPSRLSKRHRVKNNLPGVKNFCPLIYRTKFLDEMIARNLSLQAKEELKAFRPEIVMRAASFLLLQDSKASYAIEGEEPPQNKMERWGRVLGQAGSSPLTQDKLEELQSELLGDTRFVQMGYRKEGGFIGVHHRSTNLPLPSHISAKADDLSVLMEGLIEVAQLLNESNFPPVLTASLIAFGFVFIHPFEDGNGRLHRYMIHHILMESGFVPSGVVFPVSSVILKRLDQYKQVLEMYSQPRISLIEWRETEKGNVEVLNDTVDLYRYFDATPHAEFLYECIYETLTRELPEEVQYIQRYDEMKSFVSQYIDMPDRSVNLLIRFLEQNHGQLSQRAREKEFVGLSDEEVSVFQSKFAEIFGGSSGK